MPNVTSGCEGSVEFMGEGTGSVDSDASLHCSTSSCLDGLVSLLSKTYWYSGSGKTVRTTKKILGAFSVSGVMMLVIVSKLYYAQAVAVYQNPRLHSIKRFQQRYSRPEAT